MNYIEIVLEDVEKNKLDKIIEEMIKFRICDIISSHFYDKKYNKDLTFHNIKSFQDYFNNPGTCMLFLEKIEFGITLKEVLITISCDRVLGDITFNFSEEQFYNCKIAELKNGLQMLLKMLHKIQKTYPIGRILIGYEPASDNDMKMIEYSQDNIQIFNQGIFQSSFAQLLYNALKHFQNQGCPKE